VRQNQPTTEYQLGERPNGKPEISTKLLYWRNNTEADVKQIKQIEKTLQRPLCILTHNLYPNISTKENKVQGILSLTQPLRFKTTKSTWPISCV